MKLYLIRHGDYASSDITKPLNQKGEADIERMARYLKTREFSLDEIWHSSKLRAAESAQIIAKVFNCTHVKEKEYLSPNQSPQQTIDDLKEVNHDVVIVSHLPFIPHLLAKLFPEKMSTSFLLPTASVVVIECVNGQWEFVEVIAPESIS